MKFSTIFVFVAIILTSGIIWYTQSSKEQPLPVIRADNSPIKAPPENRPEHNIAHQNSTIYQAIRPNNTDKKVENLLASNEEKSELSREELLKNSNTIQKELKDNETVESRIAGFIPQNVEVKSETEEAELQKNTSEDNSQATEPVISQTPQARPKLKKQAAPKKELSNLLAEVQGLKTARITTERKKAVAVGSNYVQIGSLKSESAARSHWASRQKQFPEILNTLSLRIETVTIADRGTFYRVLGGPLSKEQAQKSCKTINQTYSKSCIVK